MKYIFYLLLLAQSIPAQILKAELSESPDGLVPVFKVYKIDSSGRASLVHEEKILKALYPGFSFENDSDRIFTSYYSSSQAGDIDLTISIHKMIKDKYHLMEQVILYSQIVPIVKQNGIYFKNDSITIKCYNKKMQTESYSMAIEKKSLPDIEIFIKKTDLLCGKKRSQ